MVSQEIKDMVDASIEKHPIMVYSKSYCPHCQAAKKLLQSFDLTGDDKPFIIELDEAEHGGEQQDYLREKTSQGTVPNIFIHGKHIGGNDKLQALNRSNELKALINA